MPMNSAAPRRCRMRSDESWSRPSPESTMKRTGWIVVSALISLVTIGRAQLTGTPSCTSAAARLRLAGVIRFIVPSWSSAPQRPQLLRLEIILITSLSVTVVAIASSSKKLEGDGLAFHPEPQVRHEDEIRMRPAGQERVAVAASHRARFLGVERELAHRGLRVPQEPRAEGGVRPEREETAIEPVGRRRRESGVRRIVHTGHSTTAFPWCQEGS